MGCGHGLQWVGLLDLLFRGPNPHILLFHLREKSLGLKKDKAFIIQAM